MYIFLLILYRLSVLPMPKVYRLALIQPLSKLLWSDRKPMVHRPVCCQFGHLEDVHRNGSLEMPELESHLLAERLVYLSRSLSSDTVWGQKVRFVFPHQVSDPKVEGCRKPKGVAQFTRECRKALRKLPRSSDLSWSGKELYRELVVASTSDPLVERLGWSLEEIRSQ